MERRFDILLVDAEKGKLLKTIWIFLLRVASWKALRKKLYTIRAMSMKNWEKQTNQMDENDHFWLH